MRPGRLWLECNALREFIFGTAWAVAVYTFIGGFVGLSDVNLLPVDV